MLIRPVPDRALEFAGEVGHIHMHDSELARPFIGARWQLQVAEDGWASPASHASADRVGEWGVG